MVQLSTDISCSTQTIEWNGTRIPWKPRTYFDDSLLQDPVTADAHCMFIDSTFEDNMDQLMDDCFFTAPIKESLYKTVKFAYLYVTVSTPQTRGGHLGLARCVRHSHTSGPRWDTNYLFRASFT
jgi:hypothetical protein